MSAESETSDIVIVTTRLLVIYRWVGTVGRRRMAEHMQPVPRVYRRKPTDKK